MPFAYHNGYLSVHFEANKYQDIKLTPLQEEAVWYVCTLTMLLSITSMVITVTHSAEHALLAALHDRTPTCSLLKPTWGDLFPWALSRKT